MARFYDTVNNADLNRVEAIMKRGGIEFSIREWGDDPSFKEIDVSEEDRTYAEWLLSSPTSPRI